MKKRRKYMSRGWPSSKRKRRLRWKKDACAMRKFWRRRKRRIKIKRKRSLSVLRRSSTRHWLTKTSVRSRSKSSLIRPWVLPLRTKTLVLLSVKNLTRTEIPSSMFPQSDPRICSKVIKKIKQLSTGHLCGMIMKEHSLMMSHSIWSQMTNIQTSRVKLWWSGTRSRSATPCRRLTEKAE